jgi:hypothetical protein
MFDYISQGVPTVQSPAAPALLADVVNGRLYVSTAAGWTNVASGVQQTLSANGAISPTSSATYAITKTSADLLTLAAPTAAGVNITVTSDSAFAHTITATGLIQDGTTGGPHNVATFAAFPGATVHFVSAPSLKWNVVSLQNVVIS